MVLYLHMEKTLLIYPAFSMFILILYLYVKNYLDNVKAIKNKTINFSYFKAYQGEISESLSVSRQTLKNQFELPIFFYFLISLILIFDTISVIDIVLSWLFVISRYMHCFIRLTSNHVPHRAKIFRFGLFVLITSWINFLYNIL